jgi:hypothetical protein
MNITQVGGLVRGALFWGLGFAVAAGWLPETWAMEIAGVGATIAVAVWSYYTNKTTAMISRVAASEKVKEVVTTQEIARADPNPKVVSLAESNEGRRI